MMKTSQFKNYIPLTSFKTRYWLSKIVFQMQIWDVLFSLDHLDKSASPGLTSLPYLSWVERQGKGPVRQACRLGIEMQSLGSPSGQLWVPMANHEVRNVQTAGSNGAKGSTIHSLTRLHESFTLYFQINTACRMTPNRFLLNTGKSYHNASLSLV